MLKVFGRNYYIVKQVRSPLNHSLEGLDGVY